LPKIILHFDEVPDYISDLRWRDEGITKIRLSRLEAVFGLPPDKGNDRTISLSITDNGRTLDIIKEHYSVILMRMMSGHKWISDNEVSGWVDERDLEDFLSSDDGRFGRVLGKYINYMAVCIDDESGDEVTLHKKDHVVVCFTTPAERPMFFTTISYDAYYHSMPKILTDYIYIKLKGREPGRPSAEDAIDFLDRLHSTFVNKTGVALAISVFYGSDYAFTYLNVLAGLVASMLRRLFGDEVSDIVSELSDYPIIYDSDIYMIKMVKSFIMGASL